MLRTSALDHNDTKNQSEPSKQNISSEMTEKPLTQSNKQFLRFWYDEKPSECKELNLAITAFKQRIEKICRCDLYLMSPSSDGATLSSKPNKLYLYADQDKFYYFIYFDHKETKHTLGEIKDNKSLEFLLHTEFNSSQDKLIKYEDATHCAAVLNITSKRGHTQSQTEGIFEIDYHLGQVNKLNKYITFYKNQFIDPQTKILKKDFVVMQHIEKQAYINYASHLNADETLLFLQEQLKQLQILNDKIPLFKLSITDFNIKQNFEYDTYKLFTRTLNVDETINELYPHYTITAAKEYIIKTPWGFRLCEKNSNIEVNGSLLSVPVKIGMMWDIIRAAETNKMTYNDANNKIHEIARDAGSIHRFFNHNRTKDYCAIAQITQQPLEQKYSL